MCTLTWTHAAGAAPSGDGYTLWFNRDELRTRGPEVPPAVESAPCGHRYVAPRDSDAGGTWIAVNEAGLTVALLNGDGAGRGEPPGAPTSRGHLVRQLAPAGRLEEVWRALSPAALRPFRPLVLVAVAPSRPALIARWDGIDLVLDPTGHRQLPLVSSSALGDEVHRRRSALFDRLVPEGARRIGAAPPSALEAFQRWAPPTGPDAFSPSMERPDACTRSQCRVEVSADHVELSYAPGPPHQAELQPPVTLARAR